jgi:hypothetical protein
VWVKKERVKRVEERKFKRIPIRFGLEKPEHGGVGIQISSRGLFISASYPIFIPGCKLVIEVKTANGSLQIPAIVRHSKKVPPQMIQFERPGMGVEFIDPPPELRAYLDSL